MKRCWLASHLTFGALPSRRYSGQFASDTAVQVDAVVARVQKGDPWPDCGTPMVVKMNYTVAGVDWTHPVNDTLLVTTALTESACNKVRHDIHIS